MRHIHAPLSGAVLFLLLIPGPTLGASRYADVRVVDGSGKTLADVRQYTDDVDFRTSEKADCFGPGSPSSNKRYELNKPNALGALVDASKHQRRLRPLLLTDAFFDDFGSFGVCGISGIRGDASSYWYSGINHAGATAGANQIPVRNGDQHVWFFTSEFDNTELELRAPARVVSGEEFAVRVIRYAGDGTPSPAPGIEIENAAGPTDAEGRAAVTLPKGTSVLQAVGGAGDIPSARLKVCAATRLAQCPRKRGRIILGSPGPDRIKGTRGPDRIECGRGDDVVLVKRSDDDRIADDCERVRRS